MDADQARGPGPPPRAGSARRCRARAERPRLAVFRSNRHIYAQLIDDVAARTLAAASDAERRGDARQDAPGPRRSGRLLASARRRPASTRAVFDRGGRLYHGRVKALADGAREGGLEIE